MQAWLVFVTWLLSTLACSQGYVGAAELTATAVVRPPQATFAPPTPLPPTLSASPLAQVDTPEPTAAPVDGAPAEATPQPTRPRPTRTATHTATAGPSPTPRPPLLYYAQAGDTLPALSAHFGVEPKEITSPDPIPDSAYIKPRQLLIIPARLDFDATAPQKIIMPDSEVVYSPSALGFDITTFVNQAGGKLATYREYMSTGMASGAEVVQRVAVENSINPRLLLAIVEYQSHWVTGQPQTLAQDTFPVGHLDQNAQGLYKQLSWAVEQLSIGYYGWQAGHLNSIEFLDGAELRLWPQANAGTVGVAYLFAQLYRSSEWGNVMNSPDLSFLSTYQKLFGSPFTRAQTVEPLFPPDLTQPDLQLPYPRGESWAFTGGPHPAWGPNGALAAVDFAPPAMTSGCIESTDWVTAAATGLVVRISKGVVVVDLDGDGFEQTGWVLLYLHVATKDRVQVGTILTVDDKIGHPSCEGGQATGTHVHFARKYNGQWMLADGPLPMVLNGWQVHAGDEIYLGTFTNGSQTATACTCGSAESRVLRPRQ